MKVLLIICWLITVLVTYFYIISIKPKQVIRPATIMIYESDKYYQPILIYQAQLNNPITNTKPPKWRVKKDGIYKFVIKY